MKTKLKPCKGTDKAKGLGCGKPSDKRRLGLCPSCYFDYLKSSGRMSSFLKTASKKAEMDRKKETREKKNSLKSSHDRFYKSTAWFWCARYVKLYYSYNGYVKCATSGVEYHVTDKLIHAGHFQKVFESNSTNYAVALEFKNILPQSYAQNVILGGNPEEMAKQIELIHGKGTVEYLQQKKKEAYKLDQYELDKWAKHYRDLFNELVKVKGNPWKSL